MKENEIRPAGIYDEFLRLAEQDALAYFHNAQLIDRNCPACDTKGLQEFKKNGFYYDLCPICNTLYVNPIPVASAFSQYYTESASSKYWATTFYSATAEVRREKLWKPKALNIVRLLVKYSKFDNPPPAIIDIGGGYGIFAEEIHKLTAKCPPIVIEPSPHLAKICRDRGIEVVDKFLEDILPIDLPSHEKVFVSFELFEHLHSPELFLNHVHDLMKSGDLFIFTTLSGTGLDIQVLYQDSKSIMPPHHINFFNPSSIRTILDRVGLDVLEISTPGLLDIDILKNNHSKIKDRFWKTFVAMASDSDKNQWQTLIASSGWSSHMMVVCQKR